MLTLTNIDLIARVPIFAGLTQLQLESVARNVVKRTYKRGEYVMRQGETTHAMYLLLDGAASVMASDGQGKDVILNTLKIGDYLGEMSLIDGNPHSASVMADSAAQFLVLGRAELQACMKDSDILAMSLLRGLVDRLRAANQKIESLALSDVNSRVAHALRSMAKVDKDGSYVIKEKVSKQRVAMMVGASREMVTRVFRDLEKSGVMRTEADKSIRILSKAS
jgi:CRP/FNR family transcriptional regulator, cyclic AMP receptor protein